MVNIQAILFDKNYFNLEDTKIYLKKHRHKPIKEVHESQNYYRYRLFEPKKGDKYFTKVVKPGIKYIIKLGKPRIITKPLYKKEKIFDENKDIKDINNDILLEMLLETYKHPMKRFNGKYGRFELFDEIERRKSENLI
jgi:hypothetical protein